MNETHCNFTLKIKLVFKWYPAVHGYHCICDRPVVSQQIYWSAFTCDCWLDRRWCHQGGWREESKCSLLDDSEYTIPHSSFLSKNPLHCTLLIPISTLWALMLCCPPLTCIIRVTPNPAPAACLEPAYSLYSTDSEDQVWNRANCDQ